MKEGYVHGVVYNTARCREVIAAFGEAIKIYFADSVVTEPSLENLRLSFLYAGAAVMLRLLPTDNRPSVLRDKWARVGICQVTADDLVVAHGAVFIHEHDKIAAVSFHDLSELHEQHVLSDKEDAEVLFDVLFEACHTVLTQQFET